MKICLAIVAAAALSGCAYNVSLMPRDSGRVYTGSLESGGGPSGTMTVSLEGDTCTGPAARVASNESFGFVSAYGRSSTGQFGTASANTYQSGDATVKAIMSCKSGKGLRCDLTGRGASGGGVCLDDAGKVYDVIATRR